MIKKRKTKENGKRKKEQEKEKKDQKYRENISVERRTPCIVRLCAMCKALYISEIPENYSKCTKCGKDTLVLNNTDTKYDITFPQYGGKA